MQLKEIHNFVKHLTELLQKKVESEEKASLPKEIKEYTKGQFYEATYILEIVEKIIYENRTYNF
jgi:hypothetical protein